MSVIVYETTSAVSESLRCCIENNCNKCHYQRYNGMCHKRLIEDAFRVMQRYQNRINCYKEKCKHQQAEIERLKTEKIIACSFIPVRGCGKTEYKLAMVTNAIEAIENQAIKEYAERLKSRHFWSKAGEEIIDNLVEEMKNESNYSESEV